MSDIELNAKNYDIWAKFYDEYPNPTVAIDELHFPVYFENLHQKNILEIGCGTGRHTHKLIGQANCVTGIDISEGMLSKLRARVQSESLHLINGDFLNEDIPSNQFDAIVVSLVLEHIADLDSFFKKCRSVLKHNGTMFVSEIHPERSAKGTLAHFKDQDGDDIHLASTSHDPKELETASLRYGFHTLACDTMVGTQALSAMNPKWEKYFNMPMIQIWHFQCVR